MRFPAGERVFSVVIPCLNEEAPIAGVVRDALAQGGFIGRHVLR
jgi:hypothetical protein